MELWLSEKRRENIALIYLLVTVHIFFRVCVCVPNKNLID